MYCPVKGTFMCHEVYCTVGDTLGQRFLILVRSAHVVCFSYGFRGLFHLTVSALQSGHRRIFRHDSSLKEVYMFHSEGIKERKM